MFMTVLKIVKENPNKNTKELLPIVRTALEIEPNKQNDFDFVIAVLIENCKKI